MPLADQIRPDTLDDVVGQEHLLGKGKPLRRIIESGHIPNMIFYGPSGIGKTTLLHMLLGLEAWDSGEILGLDGLRTAAVFQEDRLCLSFSPLENIRMAVGKAVSREEILKEAKKLLPPESLSRPAATLSGGQKRRTAILRALLAQSDLLVMDEPFTGLDDGTKELAVNYVREKARGKICVIATHDMQDAEVLNARRIPL